MKIHEEPGLCERGKARTVEVNGMTRDEVKAVMSRYCQRNTGYEVGDIMLDDFSSRNLRDEREIVLMQPDYLDIYRTDWDAYSICFYHRGHLYRLNDSGCGYDCISEEQFLQQYGP